MIDVMGVLLGCKLVTSVVVVHSLLFFDLFLPQFDWIGFFICS